MINPMKKDTVLLLVILLVFAGVFYAYQRKQHKKQQPKIALMITTCAIGIGGFIWYSFSGTVKESVNTASESSKISLLTESFPSSVSDSSLSI
jgi:protein-S-isoprenylcysteine O-methyltransferase Ste14